MKSKRRSEVSMGEAALKGALAGAVAGAAVLIGRRLQHSGILEPTEFRDDRWERYVRRAARRMGFDLSPRASDIASITTYLAYSAAVGAAFGVARVRLPLSVSATALLESGLVFAASLPLTGVIAEKDSRVRKRRKKRSLRRPEIPLAAGTIFGTAASSLFDAVARR